MAASKMAHEFLEIMTRPKADVDKYPHDKTIREMDPQDHTAYALLCVADAIRDAFYWLGSTDASTHMGALEMISGELHAIAQNLGYVDNDTPEALRDIAEAIKGHE